MIHQCRIPSSNKWMIRSRYQVTTTTTTILNPLTRPSIRILSRTSSEEGIIPFLMGRPEQKGGFLFILFYFIISAFMTDFRFTNFSFLLLDDTATLNLKPFLFFSFFFSFLLFSFFSFFFSSSFLFFVFSFFPVFSLYDIRYWRFRRFCMRDFRHRCNLTYILASCLPVRSIVWWIRLSQPHHIISHRVKSNQIIAIPTSTHTE